MFKPQFCSHFFPKTGNNKINKTTLYRTVTQYKIFKAYKSILHNKFFRKFNNQSDLRSEKDSIFFPGDVKQKLYNLKVKLNHNKHQLFFFSSYVNHYLKSSITFYKSRKKPKIQGFFSYFFYNIFLYRLKFSFVYLYNFIINKKNICLIFQKYIKQKN